MAGLTQDPDLGVRRRQKGSAEIHSRVSIRALTQIRSQQFQAKRLPAGSPRCLFLKQTRGFLWVAG